MLTRLILVLALALAWPAGADPLKDTVAALDQQAGALARQMRPAGFNLTWGQDVAAVDMERLAKAAVALNAMFLDDEEHTFEDLTPVVNELQTAAGRVRSSVPISVLDEAQQQQALGLLDKARLIKVEVDAARRVAQERQAARRARYDFGFGFGGGWGWPGYGWGGWGWPGYGWGYPGYGWGFGFGRPYVRRCR